MLKTLAAASLAFLFLLGGFSFANAASPVDTSVVRENTEHGCGWGRGGGRRGGGWRNDRDDGWRCSGGYYHYGPDRGGYYCH